MSNSNIPEIEPQENSTLLPIGDHGASSIKSRRKEIFTGLIVAFLLITLFIISCHLVVENGRMKSQISMLSNRLDNLESQLNADETNDKNNYDSLIFLHESTNQKISALHNFTCEKIEKYDTHWISVDHQLEGLENMTSNADVLLILNTTLLKMENMISMERIDVTNQISNAQSFLTSQIENSQKNWANLASSIKKNVTTELNKIDESTSATVNYMKHVIKDSFNNVSAVAREAEAESEKSKEAVEIMLIMTYDNVTKMVEDAQYSLSLTERNISERMSGMSALLQSSIKLLHDSVDDATADISKEVQVVHDNMNQYITFTNNKFAAENAFVKYQLAGFFTILACLISMWHITSHLNHLNPPKIDIQTRITAILFMVPVYSVTSWFSLFVPDTVGQILSTFRDFYEAYVVYTFIGFLIAVVANGKGHRGVELILEKKILEERREESIGERVTDVDDVRDGSQVELGLLYQDQTASTAPSLLIAQANISHTHKPLKAPFNCCISKEDAHFPKKVAAKILDQCLFLAMQFVILKIILAFIPIIWSYECSSYSLSEKTINWHCPGTYVMIIANVSVALAFYGLLCFYHLMEKELKQSCDPWPKFLCVKGVVFMTFWQGVLLEIIASLGVLDAKSALQIQNLLICIEMFMASIAHMYIFPYQEWQPGYIKVNVKLQDALALPGLATDLSRISTRRDWVESPPQSKSRSGSADSLRNEACIGPEEKEGLALIGIGDKRKYGRNDFSDKSMTDYGATLDIDKSTISSNLLSHSMQENSASITPISEFGSNRDLSRTASLESASKKSSEPSLVHIESKVMESSISDVSSYGPPLIEDEFCDVERVKSATSNESSVVVIVNNSTDDNESASV